jgi:hypothetical protein
MIAGRMKMQTMDEPCSCFGRVKDLRPGVRGEYLPAPAGPNGLALDGLPRAVSGRGRYGSSRSARPDGRIPVLKRFSTHPRQASRMSPWTADA